MDFDLLWKKNDSGDFVDIFAGVDSMDGIISREVKIGVGIHKSKKNNDISTRSRELGNKQIQEGVYYEAMRLYNISLCYAEIDTVNISLAYANRSLCFLKLEKYHQCLIDIELAINANYPQSEMGKLEKRREFCLKQMKNASTNDAPKLDFDVDENFAGMSNVLRIEYNEKFGRHFVAKCDIDVGKVVMVEEAFIAAPAPKSRSSVCDTCFKHAANFIACPNCNGALFCDQTCSDSCILHAIRCGRGGPNDDFLVEFTLRSVMHAMIIFSGEIDHWKNFVQQVIEQRTRKTVPKTLIDLKSKYRMFLELNLWLSAAEKQRMIRIGFEAYQLLMRKFKDLFDGLEAHRFLMHLIVMHASIIFCNIFQFESHGEVFLLQNHFNHSCAPNLLHTSYENKTVVITSRRIKKGDQLFISYGKEYFFESRNNRRTKLFEGFGFHCDCEKCENDKWPISSKQIESDADYQFSLRDAAKSKTSEVAKRLALKKKCIELLIKYADSIWCSQLDTVSHLYQNLSTETMH